MVGALPVEARAESYRGEPVEHVERLLMIRMAAFEAYDAGGGRWEQPPEREAAP